MKRGKFKFIHVVDIYIQVYIFYRTEVMLAEFKRDSARKELEAVLQHIHQRRSELRRVQEELMEQQQEEEGDSDSEDQVKVKQEEVRVKFIVF
jgi:hypothetical protein